MDERLKTFAIARGMAFSLSDARSLHLDFTEVRRMVRTGEVIRVRRNAYVLADYWALARPEERLALRVRAVMRSREGAVASHQSALALHGLPLFGVPLGSVDLLGSVQRTRSTGCLRVHPNALAPEPLVADGYRCVSIPEAIAQVALRSGVVPAVVSLDAALHAGRCSIREVAASLAAHSRRPVDRRIASAVLAHADGRSESVGESRARMIFVDQGFEVIPQFEIRDDEGGLAGRVDLLVDGVAFECDGAVKYAGAEGRAALIAEKRREDRIRELGYRFVRAMTSDLDRPDALVAAVRRAKRDRRVTA